MPNDAVTVVIATRNRCSGLCATLQRLTALPEQPDILVIDNGSTDGTPGTVRQLFPHVELVALRRNRGASARNVGVRLARTRYVALTDDDSWWEPGTLSRAVRLLDTTPQAGLVTGATLVGPADTPDPLNAVLAASPLSRDGLPGPRVLGFLGCAAVTRREAYLAAGGYLWLLFIGGEEELLAYDLAARGWPIVYCPDIIIHHWPSPIRDASRRRRQELCNRVLVAWLRRPLPCAARATARLARAAARDRVARQALAETALRLPVALLRRRPLPTGIEADIQRLEVAHAA